MGNHNSMRCVCRAFTLVEVLVVITIIGLAAAIVVPSMLQSGTLGVQAAARMILSDILYAQNDAIARQATRIVVFDPAHNTYQITDANGQVIAAAVPGTYVVNLTQDGRFGGVSLAAADFAGTTSLSFDALGGPQAGGSVEVTGGAARYRIQVAAVTGRVTVQNITGTQP